MNKHDGYDSTERYNDIINLDRPQSKRHTPMDMMKRAAQFAPFAPTDTHER